MLHLRGRVLFFLILTELCSGILAAQAREYGGQVLAMTATSTPTDNAKIAKLCDMLPGCMTV